MGALNRYTKREKRITTGVALEGNAFSWFQWQNRHLAFVNWVEFNVAALQQFCSSQEGNLCERFLPLRQTGSVVEYRRKFEVSAAPLHEVPEEILEGIFMNGLKPEIQTELCLLKPVVLTEIMDTAQRIEEKNWLLWQEMSGARFTKLQIVGVAGNSNSAPLQAPKTCLRGDRVERPRNEFPFKKLSDS